MARRKARQRISYVLPLASARGGHRLGVNSLAVDSKQSILYSGGRDGVICAWDLHLPSGDTAASTGAAPTVNGSAQSSTVFRTQTHAHTHWVNDIALVWGNQAVVSASSDVTVKLWRPHSGEEGGAKPETLGQHKDYVKCLATPGPQATWIASGGLDRRIRLWDLNGGGETLQIEAGEDEKAAKGSVYALSVRGSIIASGGPDSVLRLWDCKSGQRITKFLGHTDNLRSILISEGGDMLMTASSDQTIKVWSMAAGRCMNTLTMHNDSVWSLFSAHPQLLVFHSSDRSGLVAKTDLRGSSSMDEGISVAVAQEHQGVNQLVVDGDYMWTATASSSINRWQDVNVAAEIKPPDSPRQARLMNLVTRPKAASVSDTSADAANPLSDQTKKIPLNSILRISNKIAPRLRDHEAHSASTSGRKLSEAIIDTDNDNVVPVRDLPQETIEGQHGLIKHVMLNDRKRVLTLDDAGEVVLWDLLKCVPIKSYGKKHLEDVLPDVNTAESVLNWCLVDTRTGSLAITLEENYAFDAELYADETEFSEAIEFREDQRINLGKWVLRYLFSNLIDEEIRRDRTYRANLEKEGFQTDGSLKPTIPKIQTIGNPKFLLDDDSVIMPRPMNGVNPTTPGFAIGVATPGIAGPTAATVTSAGAGEEPKPSGNARTSGDYFSTAPPATPPQPASAKANETSNETQDASQSPADGEKDGKSGSLFGKKFRMNFPKKLGRTSVDQAKPPATDEKDKESDKSSEKEDKIVEDNFYGVIQKIRNEYDEKLTEHPSELPEIGIAPSLPSETPVLKPPSSTTIVIQEDSLEAGGVADLYRGTVSSLGQDADLVEKAAPMWLGELLLRNQLPIKDPNKLSFILLPFEELLPGIASADGNARLNANRMLRAKKVLGYVTERIDPVSEGEEPDPNALKPEQYLDLYCQNQLVHPNMTLATLRTHIWKAAGDLVLYYKSNGRKPELEQQWAEKKAKEAAEHKAKTEAEGNSAGTTDTSNAATS